MRRITSRASARLSVSRDALLFGLCVFGATTPAFAQSQDRPADTRPAAAGTASIQAPAAADGDIVVTATRQNVGSQRVPIALTAVGAQQLDQQGITSATQLNQVSPSLYVLGTVSEGSPRFTLRGLTFTDTQATGSPAVATYIDDVYQSFQFGIYTSLYDLQRVEILRGPQGTTFGRNTTGGAVAYFNQTPTNRFEGNISARVAAGDQGQQFIEGAVNVPVIDDRLALRFSGNATWKDTYVHDIANGIMRGASDSQSGRVQLRYTPDRDTSVSLTLFALRRDGDAPIPYGQVYASDTTVPTPAPTPGIVSLSPLSLYDRFRNGGATLRIEHSFGLLSLTAISHYRKTRYRTSQDLDGFPDGFFSAGLIPDTNYIDRSDAEQYGQEVRISSDPTKRLSGIVGLYYEHDLVKDQISYADVLDGIGIDYNNYFRYTVATDAYAIFGNLKFNMTDTLSVIGGVRKSVENKKDNGTSYYFLDGNFDWTQGNVLTGSQPPVAPSQTLPYRLRQKARPLTWDATANYNPSASLLIYARVAKGFRSGGFNPPAFVADPAGLPAPVPLTYTGESVQSYEGGVKIGLLNNKLRINASGFHYDYTNQQVTDYAGGYPTTRNNGKSRINGGEIEVTATPTRGLELRGSVSYTDAKYLKYTIADLGVDYSENTLQQSPKWTANGALNYTLPIDRTFNLNANTTWSYRSGVFFDSANSSELATGSLTTGNIRLALEPASGKGLSVAAFVNNVTDKRALASGFAFVPDIQYIKFFDIGRLFGVDVSYRW